MVYIILINKLLVSFWLEYDTEGQSSRESIGYKRIFRFKNYLFSYLFIGYFWKMYWVYLLLLENVLSIFFSKIRYFVYMFNHVSHMYIMVW